MMLVIAAFLYSVRYFKAVEGLFHGLMLLFMAGMIGFCLTGDLFNLLVFFEVMSAAAYALTAYKIEERGPIQGAINRGITNSIGGDGVCIGLAMLYARTGALKGVPDTNKIVAASGHGVAVLGFAIRNEVSFLKDHTVTATELGAPPVAPSAHAGAPIALRAPWVLDFCGRRPSCRRRQRWEES